MEVEMSAASGAAVPFDVADWVPMRWPRGWREPSLLRLIENTAVNCLVVDWDARARAELGPVASAARQAGLAVVGLVSGEADAGDVGSSMGVRVIRRSPHARPPAAPDPLALAFTDCVWPSISLGLRGSGDRVSAGPTGVPWVDSNGWFILLARALAPVKPVWIVAEPPEKNTVLPVEASLLAVADAAAYGARWVISLSQDHSRCLASADSEALASWKRIAGSVAFFEKHREWRSFRPVAALGVLSDFSGANETTSCEVLNLLRRRNVGFHILDKARPDAIPKQGLRAIVYADADAPKPELREKLLEFVKAGGLLVFPTAASSLVGGMPLPDQVYFGFEVRGLGKGRVAVPREDVDDPYILATTAHLLLSRRNDVVRTWNGSPTVAYFASRTDGKQAMVAILNYSTRAVSEMSVRVVGSYRAARLWSAESDAPAPLVLIRDRVSTEIHLPPIGVCGMIELEA